MELFFVLSGAGAWYALERRSGGQFLWERVQRLLIPLYTMGLFILIPPQVYFEEVTNWRYTGTFWEFLPLSMGIVPKFLIIAVISFALIMALYELLIKRFNIVRFFFGMRPRKVQALPAPSTEETAA